MFIKQEIFISTKDNICSEMRFEKEMVQKRHFGTDGRKNQWQHSIIQNYYMLRYIVTESQN
jgi:hypothetical protein